MPMPTELSVQRVRRETVIIIPVSVRNSSEGQVFVPYCGELGKSHLLCTLAVHLEIRSAGRWQPVRAKSQESLFGGLALDNGILLNKGQEESFIYQFDATFFDVARGQELRLLVDSWPDQASMKTGANTVQFRSVPFVMP